MEVVEGIDEVMRAESGDLSLNAGEDNRVHLPPIPDLNWKIINPYEEDDRSTNKIQEEQLTNRMEEDMELIRENLYNKAYRCYKKWGVVFSSFLMVMQRLL